MRGHSSACRSHAFFEGSRAICNFPSYLALATLFIEFEMDVE